MNTKKVAFIACVNDREEFAEAEYYLNRLILPEDFEKDIIVVEEAPSMTCGYNAAMESSDAKYKVYLHQDVFIINPNFVLELLKIFEQSEMIGAVGCIGCDNLPLDAKAISAWNCGKIYHNCIPSKTVHNQGLDKEPMTVEAVDGLLIATQYDVRWRDDLFDGWDFYDISQCFEMKRLGYEVVIPWQSEPWCFHDCTHSKLSNYQKYCKRLVEEYQDIKPFQNVEYQDAMKAFTLVKEESRAEMIKLVNAHAKQELISIFQKQENCGYLHLREFEVLAAIEGAERETGANRFWKADDTFEDVISHIRQLKFALKRVEYDADDNNDALQFALNNFSIQAVNTVFNYYVSEKEKVKEKLIEFTNVNSTF